MFWQGETTVGIRGSFGLLKIGRMIVPYQIAIPTLADPWFLSTVASPVFYAGYSTDYIRGGEGRAQRAIYYFSPTFGSGFSFDLDYGFDKGPTGKTTQGFALKYNNGPLGLALGGERNRFADSIIAFAAKYDFGPAAIMGDVYRTKGGAAADRAGSTFFSTATFAGQVGVNSTLNGWSLSGSMPMGAALFKIGYSRWNGNGAAGTNNKESKFGIGVFYSLSKRTGVYTDLATQTNKNCWSSTSFESKIIDAAWFAPGGIFLCA